MGEEGRSEKEWMDYCIALRDQHKVLNRRYEEKARQGKVGVIRKGGRAILPVLFSNGRNLAEAWENSLIALWVKGQFIRTQYDRKESTGLYIDPPSKDCTIVMTVEEPLSEPKIHKDFPGGLNDLEEYGQEVVDGIKDGWIRDPRNPEDKRWEYTYHGRARKFKAPGLEQAIDQFEAMAQIIAKNTITRRGLMISWQPWEDLGISDPACWQQTWGRVFREHPEQPKFALYSDENTGKPKLNLNWLFRSRDAYKAAFMNLWGFTAWGDYLAQRVSEIREEKVVLGGILDASWSYHIYGQDFNQFLNTFTKNLYRRHFLPEEGLDNDTKARTMYSNSELAQQMFGEARKQIPVKIAQQDEKYAKREGLTKDSTQLFKNP